MVIINGPKTLFKHSYVPVRKIKTPTKIKINKQLTLRETTKNEN